MTQTLNIDKALDKFSKDFTFRHDIAKWYLLSAIVCVLPFVASLFIPSLSGEGFSTVAVSLLACGAVIFICLMAYYTVGDSKVPYFKPSHELMERCELYFDVRNTDKIKALLSAGDFKSIAELPRNHSQQCLIIMYKTPKSNVICAQIADVRESHFIPASDIYMFRQQEHNVPSGTKLLDFFYKDMNN